MADRRNDVAVAAFEDGIRTGVQVENDRSSLKRKNEFADVPESGKRMRYMLGNTVRERNSVDDTGIRTTGTMTQNGNNS